MDKVDQFILEHRYDPVKAHEYYLRTRQLKGRRGGGSATTTGRTPSLKTAGADRTGATTPSSERSRAEVKARVDALKGRLEKLKELLDELVEQAKKRSGVETPRKPQKRGSSSAKTKKDAKPATAAEKKAAKERYEKEKAKNPSLRKEERQLQEEIAEVREKIEKAREDLRAAIVKARKRASKKTATKTTRPLERNSQNGS